MCGVVAVLRDVCMMYINCVLYVCDVCMLCVSSVVVVCMWHVSIHGNSVQVMGTCSSTLKHFIFLQLLSQCCRRLSSDHFSLPAKGSSCQTSTVSSCPRLFLRRVSVIVSSISFPGQWPLIPLFLWLSFLIHCPSFHVLLIQLPCAIIQSP